MSGLFRQQFIRMLQFYYRFVVVDNLLMFKCIIIQCPV